jgi:hypothetical protein
MNKNKQNYSFFALHFPNRLSQKNVGTNFASFNFAASAGRIVKCTTTDGRQKSLLIFSVHNSYELKYLAGRAVASLNAEWPDRRHWKLDRLLAATAPQFGPDGQTLSQRLKFRIVRTECLKQVPFLKF